MFKNLRIETERLIIRPLTSADAEDMHAVVSQENVMRFLPQNVMSLDEVKGIISWLNDCYEKNSPDKIIKYTVGIEWKDDRRIIGWVGLGPLDFEPTEIEIFYGLSEKYWGKGIATEAVMAMLYYGFRVIGLRKIVAVTDCQNVRSLKVIKK
jgi:ribosomal-protein-alanine N-acetyltransferase